MNSGFTIYNQTILNDSESEVFNRRSHLYGDGLFETLRVHKGKICFWESHYFRLMSSMRILRLEIPLNWSPDDLEKEILSFKPEPQIDYRVRFSVWREGGLGYAPTTNSIDWSINFSVLDDRGYSSPVKKQELALFQEHKKSKGLLSNLKLSESILYILAAKFASEQHTDDAIILSQDNHVLETSRGNIFLLKGNELMTPSLEDGALRGVMREQILKYAKDANLTPKEEKVNPFDLLKADEIWITNAITGIVSVSHYRKSTYGCLKGDEMQVILNSKFE